MFKPFFFIVSLLLTGVFSCSHSKKVQATTAQTLSTSESATPASLLGSLTEAEARERAQRVSNVEYDLEFRLGNTDPDFQGRLESRFLLSDNSKSLRVDFDDDGTLDSVELNGQLLKMESRGGFFMLPSKNLLVGANTLKIAFHAPYSKTGAGLYRFKDPEDGKTYIYSDFEPFDAHRLFPCFDQPDLKARYTVKADVPADWTVITSVREEKTETVGDGRRLWTFPQSASFSTYIFSLHAGSYTQWTGKAGRIPLRLFARASWAKHVPFEEWLKITAQGFAFYEKYFGTPYPFVKYDQVIVPDFNSGAMENVAAVTYSERYLSRGKLTRAQRYEIGEVILHEMAHMWFGDLVTMTWWNDLWLNESFASYMSILALAEGTEFKESWIAFQSGFKQWAYWEDQLVTTHPIEADVRDTTVAFNTLDGITYGKGSSVLHQLAFWLGPDKFRAGVKLYFQTYAYKNTRLVDFMQSLATASNTDLGQWTQQWLQTAGLNKVRAEYECHNNQIRNFSLIQSAASPEHPTLRNHRTQVGLFNIKQGRWSQTSKADAYYSGDKQAQRDLDKAACPDFVFPNLGDYDYAKVQLDPISLKNASSALRGMPDPLLRMMIWQTLWEMVRDAEMPLESFVDTIVAALPHETNSTLLTAAMELVPNAVGYLSSRTPAETESRRRVLDKLESFLIKMIDSSPAGSDRQKLAFDKYVEIVESSEGQAKLLSWIKGKSKLKGFTLDQDRRWTVIVRLNALDHVEGESLRAAETQKDNSSDAELSSLAAQAARSDVESKKAFWAMITANPPVKTLAQMRAIAGAFFPAHQENLRGEFAPMFFDFIHKEGDKLPPEIMKPFVRRMTPSTCDTMSTNLMTQFIDSHPNLNAVAMRQLMINRQENERCMKIRNVK